LTSTLPHLLLLLSLVVLLSTSVDKAAIVISLLKLSADLSKSETVSIASELLASQVASATAEVLPISAH